MNHYSDIEKQVEKAVEAANEAGGRDILRLLLQKFNYKRRWPNARSWKNIKWTL